MFGSWGIEGYGRAPPNNLNQAPRCYAGQNPKTPKPETLESQTHVQDFDRAVSTLEALPLSPEAEAQWRSLAALALQHEDLAVAERCAAALGEVSRADYLHKVSAST